MERIGEAGERDGGKGQGERRKAGEWRKWKKPGALPGGRRYGLPVVICVSG